jgi:transcriptional regulator with XRE-family HTH domain
MINDLEIGRRIERYQTAISVSQRDLAERTGISQSTLSRIVSGARAAKMDELVSLAWGLGVTVDALTTETSLRDRVLVGTRADPQADIEGVLDSLVYLLEVGAILDRYGIQDRAVQPA